MTLDTQEKGEQEDNKNSYHVFETKHKAETGITIPLVTPEGHKTNHWIKVRSKLSHVYEKMKAEIGQKMVRDLAKGRHLIDQIDDDRKLVASLVKEWSFDEPCTLEEVRKFLENAPQFKDEIEEVASDVKQFFEKKHS